jgi:hypothetical protein
VNEALIAVAARFESGILAAFHTNADLLRSASGPGEVFARTRHSGA